MNARPWRKQKQMLWSTVLVLVDNGGMSAEFHLRWLDGTVATQQHFGGIDIIRSLGLFFVSFPHRYGIGAGCARLVCHKEG